MTTRLRLIRQLEFGRYQVELEALASGQVVTFTFTVEDGDIQVVESPPDFVEYLGCRMAPAAPVLEAVRTFHRAQNLQFSD